jgi:hypothetical protein
VENPSTWAIEGDYAKKADYMQRSGKARTPVSDSAHVWQDKIRISEVASPCLPMDERRRFELLSIRHTIPGIRPTRIGRPSAVRQGRAARRVGMAAQLRVFRGSPDDSRGSLQAPTVGIRLGDLLPLIAAAQRGNYVWVQDFLDDEVRITADFYDVLNAFRSYRPAG